MTIVNVDQKIKVQLKNNPEFSSIFLDNCLNSKFLAIEEDGDKIVGACFVGGILNSNGIEINEKFRGRGVGKKLLNEILNESHRRNLSFLTGVFKPTNKVSIKTHTKIGFRPIFTFYYNNIEGKEIVVILPFTMKGTFMFKIMKFFDTRIGNIIFGILLTGLRPFLKNLIAFSNDKMPKIDLIESIKKFEKVKTTIREIDLDIKY